MARVCVFDVNETLLDLGSLDPLFERAFGDAAVRRSWFQQVLQSAFTATITGAYSDFGTVGAAALEMTAEREGVRLSDEDKKGILGGMRELPPHPEVPAALDLLRDAGLRLAALTNNAAEVAEAQLENAGLSDRFEKILSADAVRRLKPAPEPYHAAAVTMGVEISGVRLVAAHSWDVAGAMRAGCAAAFVARPGMVLDPLAEPPDVVGADLSEVAASIIAAET
ncbi:MAG: Cryptic haloacid dehalogenase 1 [uncultured Rubrobacteraceae bacterium]|uniref:Cryptic haloacid dehalogenase 1 n=1 Tax=uncultured Rubrobacteraceae bacterium TaxID=349277 RepID=A0A6J4PMQ0_9ACTN|nr:MAG: Cryptic haloacid dehalogenase 1 [uncultured Rubrobacteraceae bacterium]